MYFLISSQIASQFEVARIVPPPPTFSETRRRGRGGRNFLYGCLSPHEFIESYSPHPRGSPDLPSLRNLRLTSKAFHQAATRVLFRCSNLSWLPGHQIEEEKHLRRECLLSGSPLCSAIKNFRLVFRGSQSDFMPFHFNFNRVNDDSVTQQLDASKMAVQSLAKIVANLSNLEFLDVSIGSPWESTCERYGLVGEILPGSAPQVDIELVSSFANEMATCLRLPSMQNLTALHLALPSTYNFIEVGKGIPDNVWKGLRLLFLDVMDSTGPGGSKQYLNFNGDGGYPPSNLQEQYPNAKFAHGVFDIVDKCTNLDTLGIWGSHILDGNLLEWKPASKGLKSLYLQRIKISAPNLIQLLSPSKDLPLSQSHLAKVWLADVDLTYGTWSHVFAHLTICPLQWYLNPSNLGYTPDGKSAELRHENVRPYENHSVLWSLHPVNEATLKRLVRKRVKESGGRDFYPNQYMEMQVLL